MYQQTYYMDKRTGTFADPLAAYGLAAVLDRLLAHGLGERGDEVLSEWWCQSKRTYFPTCLAPTPPRVIEKIRLWRDGLEARHAA